MTGFSIRISGAEEVEFRCDVEDTVLSGALRGGIRFPYECNSGGCGACQFELLEGELEELWADAPGLSPRARERGRRLACQSVPASDCTIRASLDNKESIATPPRRRELTFVKAQPLTPEMSEFHFLSAGSADFLPGQFAMLKLPGVRGGRAYSMSNVPNGEGAWRFVIKRVPGGTGTGYLFDTIKPGDRIVMDAPYGNSYLRAGNGRDIVCVAGGSGLSPVLSILRGAVRAPELSDRKLYLFYGGRGPQDICLADIFSADPLLAERVEVHAAISDDKAPGADSWSGERGFVHELVRKVLGEKISTYDYYFCGPPQMTDAVHRMLLLDCKVSSSHLFFDRFY